MAVSDYSTTPASNTAISGINIAEGCSPAGLNNAIRQLMADVKTFSGTVQTLDADLTSWAGVTRASGFDTFAATPSSANLRALLTDEVGTGAAYFVGGALGTPASVTLTNATGLPFAGLAADAVRLSSEGYTSPTDTELATTAWVNGFVGAQRGNSSAVATTSGTTFTVTSIPANIRTLYLHFDLVSLTVAGQFYLQLGTSAGFVNSGYSSSTSAGTTDSRNTALFLVDRSGGGASSGTLTLRRKPDTNRWILGGILTSPTSGSLPVAAGIVTLPGVLDRVWIAASSGSFNGGEIVLEWEF